MLLVNSKQFDPDQFKFFCFLWVCYNNVVLPVYLNISILDSPSTANIYLKNYS